MKKIGPNLWVHDDVIDGNMVKEYVGIGWIELRKATPGDAKRYPRVQRGEE